MRRIDDLPQVGNKYGSWTVVGLGRKTSKRSYLICKCQCGRETEVLRENVLSGKSTGCRTCSGRNGNKNPAWKGYGEIPQNYYAIMCKSALVRGINVSVSIEDINALWTANGGVCALSGVAIEITGRKNGRITASVDRINPSKCYEIGNLQFVHKDVNRMKNKFHEPYFIEMCKKIVMRAAA